MPTEQSDLQPPGRKPDQWGRTPTLLTPPDRARPMSKAEWWVLAVLRGVLFLGGAFCALVATAALAYSGSVPVVVVCAVLSMAPAALVCWVLTATKAGDWWTFAYVSVWAAAITVATLRDLIVSAF